MGAYPSLHHRLPVACALAGTAINFSGGDKYLVAALAAGSVILYVVAIALYAHIWGRKLSRLILTYVSEEGFASKKERARASKEFKKTLHTIRDLCRELKLCSLWCLFALLLMGGAFAVKNTWLIQSSILCVFLAQFQLVRSTCKSAGLGESRKGVAFSSSKCPNLLCFDVLYCLREDVSMTPGSKS